MTAHKFQVVVEKLFVGGALNGLTATDTVRFPTQATAQRYAAEMDQKLVLKPVGGSPYQVRSARVEPLS